MTTALEPTQPSMLPVTFDTVELRGHYVDLEGKPVAGRIEFTPSATTLVVSGERTIVVGKTLTVNLVNGRFSIRLPATDDPQVNDGYDDFYYRVEEIFAGLRGRAFDMRVPVSRQVEGIDISEAGPQPTGTEVGSGTTDGGTVGTTVFNNSIDGGGVQPAAP